MRRCLILLSAILIMISAGADTFIIIANAENKVTEISKELLKHIYLGKKTKLDDGKKIVPVMLKDGEVFGTFVKEITGKTSIQFNTFWKKAIFTGKGKPPKSFETEEKLVEYIKANKDAIGFIGEKTGTEEVKVIKVK
ncbi:MAG: hypothetical protein ACOCWO_03350 [Candidatus Muiribacteriaceae bacterium]